MKFECNLLYLSLFVVVAKSILILFVASVPIYVTGSAKTLHVRVFYTSLQKQL